MQTAPMRPRERRKGSAGMTLIEVSLSMAVVAVLMLAAVSAFTSNLKAVGSAQTTTRASIFLEATLENLAALGADELLALNGNRFYDAVDAEHSSYAIDLAVFAAAVDLVQVEAVLVDLRTERAMGQVTTLRARR
jgi:prepilin-type N-terminal cleavage/methylation domain-containing protein